MVVIGVSLLKIPATFLPSSTSCSAGLGQFLSILAYSAHSQRKDNVVVPSTLLRSLLQRRQILGDDHPDTIKAIGNLAGTLGDLGQRDEVVKMLQEVLEKRRRVLGDEHIDTIKAMSNLAVVLGDLGQRDEVVKMLQEVLEKRRQVLGDEHIDTIKAMSNLAVVLGDLGQLDEAAVMLQEVLRP
jgi:tetratricopeptide (TPR) repeat protein